MIITLSALEVFWVVAVLSILVFMVVPFAVVVWGNMLNKKLNDELIDIMVMYPRGDRALFEIDTKAGQQFVRKLVTWVRQANNERIELIREADQARIAPRGCFFCDKEKSDVVS
jgi:hypothetical protein